MPPQPEYLQFGGQAILEGVMMRSPTHFAVACRAPNGEIALQSEEIDKTWIGRQKWLKLPFLRGTLALLDSMALGSKAMRYAANIHMDPAWGAEVPAPKPKKGKAASVSPAQDGAQSVVDYPRQSGEDAAPVASAPESKKIQEAAVAGSMIVGLGLGLLIFVFLPNYIVENTVGARYGLGEGVAKNYAAEVLKIIFFIGYVWLISKLPEIGRVFMYHGAEHKAINNFESGLELSVDNCRTQTRLHPRCGTSFAIVVLLISFLLFPLVPRYPIESIKHIPVLASLVRFFIELMFLPLVSGLAYEAIRYAGRRRNQKLVQALFWPGLMTQYITTKEPNDGQMEVALAALNAVIPAKPAQDTPVTNQTNQIEA